MSDATLPLSPNENTCSCGAWRDNAPHISLKRHMKESDIPKLMPCKCNGCRVKVIPNVFKHGLCEDCESVYLGEYNQIKLAEEMVKATKAAEEKNWKGKDA